MTGGARIESNSGNSFSDGDQVNHNYGLNVKNPVQYAGHETGAFHTAKVGTDDASVMDSASGYGAIGLATLGVAMGADMKFNKGGITKATSETFNELKHKLKGNISGKDLDGNKGVFYSESNWGNLEKEGMAKKTESGWELTEDRKKAKSFIDSQPSSAGVNKPQIAAPTNQTASPKGMPINQAINTPLNDISDYNTDSKKTNINPTSALGDELSGGKTIKANKNDLDIIAPTSNTDLGKIAIKEKAKAIALKEFEDASKTGNPEAIETAEKKLDASNRVLHGASNGEVSTKIKHSNDTKSNKSST